MYRDILGYTRYKGILCKKVTLILGNWEPLQGLGWEGLACWISSGTPGTYCRLNFGLRI